MIVGSIYNSMFASTPGYRSATGAELAAFGVDRSTMVDSFTATASSLSSALTSAVQSQISGGANLAAQAALTRIKHSAGTAVTNLNSRYSGPSTARLLASNPNIVNIFA
jgi:hypothetical protein